MWFIRAVNTCPLPTRERLWSSYWVGHTESWVSRNSPTNGLGDMTKRLDWHTAINVAHMIVRKYMQTFVQCACSQGSEWVGHGEWLHWSAAACGLEVSENSREMSVCPSGLRWLGAWVTQWRRPAICSRPCWTGWQNVGTFMSAAHCTQLRSDYASTFQS